MCRAASCGFTTAFQPAASSCSDDTPPRSAAVAAEPSRPTAGSHCSSWSVSTSVRSAPPTKSEARTAASFAWSSSVPLTTRTPPAAATSAVPLTTSGRPERSAAAGSCTEIVSGAWTS